MCFHFLNWAKINFTMVLFRKLTQKKNKPGWTFCIFLFQPLCRDLLTERQAGVRVQVTSTSIVAISVTQLTAWRYSAICAAGGGRNNWLWLQVRKIYISELLQRKKKIIQENESLVVFVKHMHNLCKGEKIIWLSFQWFYPSLMKCCRLSGPNTFFRSNQINSTRR